QPAMPVATPPAPAPAPPPAALPAAPPPQPALAAEAGPPQQVTTTQKRPGAWAHGFTGDQAAATGKKTNDLAPSEIKQVMGAAPAPAGAAPDVDGPYLQIISGARASLNAPLRGGQNHAKEWSVGSDPERDVVLPDEGVSAFHARIVNEGQRWKVVD